MKISRKALDAALYWLARLGLVLGCMATVSAALNNDWLFASLDLMLTAFFLSEVFVGQKG